MRQDIYHVRLGDRRTTVSLDNIISVLLSLKLGYEPGTEDAQSAVRAYLQAKLDENNDPGRSYVSQWLREAVLLDIVDKKLSSKYWAWFEATPGPAHTFPLMDKALRKRGESSESVAQQGAKARERGKS